MVNGSVHHDLRPTPPGCGQLCYRWSRVELPLSVCQSAAGFYIGCERDNQPYSRESVEYYRTPELAQEALDTGAWTQRAHP